MFAFTKSKPKAGKFSSMEDALPIFTYEDNKLILKDGRVAVGYRIEAAEMERWDQAGFDSAHAGYQAALRNLPPGCVVQKTDIYYDRPYVHPPSPDQYFTQRMGDYFEKKIVLYYDGYLFLSFNPVPARHDKHATKLKSPRTTSVLNALINRADEALPADIFASVEATKLEAERYASEFVEAMRSLPDVQLLRLDQYQLEQLYLQFMNLDFDGQPRHYSRELLNEVGTLAVGEKKVTAVSMVGQGKQVHPCVMNGYKVISPMVFPLTNFLQVPHIFTQSVLIQDTKETLAAQDKDRRFNVGLSRLATADNFIRIQELADYEAEVRAEGKQTCLLHVSLLLWETVDLARAKNVETAAAALRQIYDSEAAIESFNTLLLFMSSLPGNGFQIPDDRWLPTTTDRAACYFHWTQSYRSTQTGEYICDRFRNLKRVNLFDTSQDNQNSLTIGPSGSGKSYTMGNLIIQRYENRARQIIIDVGGSYRNVCQALTGSDFVNTYFEYDPQNPIEFNPFLLPRNKADSHWLYSDEKKTFHLALLGILWKQKALKRPEEVLMGRYLTEYYAHLNRQETLGHTDEDFPGMDSFFRFVKAQHEYLMLPASTDISDADLVGRREQYRKDVKYVKMNHFFLVVGDFAAGGRYAKVLNARRDVDLSDYRLICFDMARVKTDLTLYPVVAMLITELSLDLFRKFPDATKYILMDEAWSMLSGAMQDFVENMYRTIRKTKGSMGIITQGVAEIEKSEIGQVIIDNSATKIILRHLNPTTRQRLQGALGFSPHDMDLINSLRSTKTSWREFFIKQGTSATVFTLEVPPQMNAILTSKPEERSYLNSLVERYKRKRPVPVLDPRGDHAVNPVTGEPLYTTVTETRLEPAVEAFVETYSADQALMAAWISDELEEDEIVEESAPLALAA